jgi:microcin C transport system substrate-binding protein
MSDMNPVDQARRRLALMLLGTPMVGELHAAVAASSPASAANAAAASAATAEGEDFTGRWVHAFAAYGPPKYGPGFKHFDYVNPDAPKGGTLKLKNPDRRTSFDKYNPWTTRGNAPSGVLIWMVEGLATWRRTSRMAMYGLLAEAVKVAPTLAP